jgi:hypothetical protein
MSTEANVNRAKADQNAAALDDAPLHRNPELTSKKVSKQSFFKLNTTLNANGHVQKARRRRGATQKQKPWTEAFR